MPYNILVVDDSSSMRKVLRKTIMMCGIGEVNFSEACNGKEALDVIRDEWIDVIFTDLNMPIMTGFELVQALRKDEAVNHTPIIVVTSDTNAENSEEMVKGNIKHIIYKPFRPEEVRTLLLNLLGMEDIPNEENSDSEGLDF